MSFKFIGVLSIVILISNTGWAATYTSTAGGGNWNAPGSWTLNSGFPGATDDVVIVSGATITVNTTSASLTLTMNSGTLAFNPGQILTVNGLMTMNGISSVTGGGGGRILNLLSDFIIPAGQAGSFGGLTVSQTASKNFTISGSFTTSSNAGTKTLGNLILNQSSVWNATSNETYTFAGNGQFFDGCLIDGSKTATIAISGNLIVSSSVAGLKTTLARISLTVTGTTTISGYFLFGSSAAGTKTFNNTIGVNPGGTWDNTIGEDPVINCSILNNGSWPDPTGGTGVYYVNVAGTYTYSGSVSSTIGMSTLYLNSAANVTNTTTLRLISAGTGTNAVSPAVAAPLVVISNGTFVNGNAGYLSFTQSTDPVATTGIGSTADFSTTGNTVDYSSSGPQNVYSTGTSAYYKLFASNSGTKTIAGTTIANNLLTISGSAIVDVSGGIDLTGTATLNMAAGTTLRLSSGGTVPALTGTPNVLSAGSTIEFYRGGTQTAASSATFPYQNILISGAGGNNVNVSGVTNILGNLTVNNFGLFNSNAALSVGGIFSYGSSSGTASTLTNDISTSYFSGSAGLLNFTTNNKKIVISGNGSYWQNNGVAFSATGANVSFGNGTGQTIQGSTNSTFSTLIMNNTTGNTTLSGVNITINTALNFASGKLVTDATHYVIASSSATQNASAGTGWVYGNFRRLVDTTSPPVLTFPVGTTGNYVPVSLTLTGVTNTTGFLTVSATDGDSPDVYSALFDVNHTINRYWTIKNSDGSTPAVAFTSIAGTMNFIAGDIDSGFNFAIAALKGYNLSTATWSDIVNPIVTYTGTSVSFTGIGSVTFPVNQGVNFQIGQTYTVQTMVNRRTQGTYSWNAKDTWFQYRSGGLTFNGTNIVTGTSTKFLSELSVTDVIMLSTDVNTTYTVTTVDSDTQIHIATTPSGALTPSPVQFGRQIVPGSLDAVTIGSTLPPLTNTSSTTITVDANSQAGTIDVGTSTVSLAKSQILTHTGTFSMTVGAVATVNPGNAVTNFWNINGGSAISLGDFVIGSTLASANTYSANVALTGSGSLTTNNLKFKTGGAGDEREAILDMSASEFTKATVTGALTFVNGQGSLKSIVNGANASTFIYKGTSGGGQTFGTPPSNASSARWTYGNVWCENTTSGGLSVLTNMTVANVTGNVEIHAGAKMTLGANAKITGNPAQTFLVSPGGTFETTSTNGNAFPISFGTFSMGTTAPFGNVYYNNTSNNIGAVDYGNLYFINNPSTALAGPQTYTVPAASNITVYGDLTLGDGVTTQFPTLTSSATSTFDIRGNVKINSGSTINATNITSMKVGGNWTNNGAFTQGTGTVEFSGLGTSATQTISGTASPTFYNLKINTDLSTDIVQLAKNVTATNGLTLSKGGLDLNAFTFSVTKATTTAVSGGATGSYIKSENTTAPYGTLSWSIGTGTGLYVFPFGKSATEYIPMTINITGAGSPVGSTIAASTYATPANNTPLPSTVTNLNGTSGGNSVVDRFWVINTTGYGTTRPTATHIFTAVGTDAFPPSEKPGSIPAIGSVTSSPAGITGQRWNSSGYWDNALASQTFSNNQPNSGFFQVSIPAVSVFSASSWALTDASIPLPITLKRFTATVQSNKVNIDWDTETELNNALFTVQKTSDGEDFRDVVQVNGAGTSTEAKHYSTTDYRPSPGIWYYRLKQTDFDGNFTYSKLVMVDVPESLAWIVYPNPSNGSSINIQFGENDLGKVAYVKIQDVGGKEVMLTNVTLTSPNLQLATSQTLSPGVYIVSIIVDQSIVRQKLVVR